MVGATCFEDCYGAFTPIRSNGPDQWFGPSCCRSAGGCDPYSEDASCADSCCCCDPCKHDIIGPVGIQRLDGTRLSKGGDACDGHCCKCVPRAFVAVFRPYTPTDQCRTKASLMQGGHELISSEYIGHAGVQIKIRLERVYAECLWILQVPELGIDEQYPLSHAGGEITCTKPPRWVIPNVSTLDPCGYPCPGEITIEVFDEEAKVPFIHRSRNIHGDNCVEEFFDTNCGACEQGCRVLCVKRGHFDGYEEVETNRNSFNWDEYEQEWVCAKNNCDDPDCIDRIELVEYGGACYLHLRVLKDSLLEEDLIEIDEDECALGMNLYAADEDEWIRISCNPCEWCWEHICGTCRCVCKNMCVMGSDNGTLIDPFTLPWEDKIDADSCQWSHCWTDGYTSICVIKDPCGICKLITPWNPPDNPETPTVNESHLDMPQICGSGIIFDIFHVDKNTGEWFWRVGGCSLGLPCGVGNCLDQCDAVPELVMVDVEMCEGSWDEPMCYTEPDCVTAFTVPLLLIRNPDPSAAAEFLWKGKAAFTFKRDCFSTAGDEIRIIDLTLGCDGILNLRILLPEDDGTFTLLESADGTVGRPCTVCGVPFEGSFEIDVAPCKLCLTFTEGAR